METRLQRWQNELLNLADAINVAVRNIEYETQLLGDYKQLGVPNAVERATSETRQLMMDDVEGDLIPRKALGIFDVVHGFIALVER